VRVSRPGVPGHQGSLTHLLSQRRETGVRGLMKRALPTPRSAEAGCPLFGGHRDREGGPKPLSGAEHPEGGSRAAHVAMYVEMLRLGETLH